MALLIHTYELGEKELDPGGSCKECKSQLRESSYWRMYCTIEDYDQHSSW